MFHKPAENSYISTLKVKAKNQRGSALVIAIFVIVVLSLIGAALVRMQSSSSETVVYEVVGTRAYAAAQAGIQWQLAQLFPLNNLGVIACPLEPTELNFSSTTGLESCRSVVIDCDDGISHGGIQYYTIDSTSTCSVGNVTTSRTIQVQAKNIQ